MYFKYGTGVLKGRRFCSNCEFGFHPATGFPATIGAVAHDVSPAAVNPGPATIVPTPAPTFIVTGVGWLISRSPINLAPWLPTYPISNERLLVRDLWRSRVQVSTSGVRSFGS